MSPQVTPLSTAPGRPPSPRVRWRLLELLYGYALALRLYNGSWPSDPAGAAGVLLAAAPFLGWVVCRGTDSLSVQVQHCWARCGFKCEQAGETTGLLGLAQLHVRLGRCPVQQPGGSVTHITCKRLEILKLPCIA